MKNVKYVVTVVAVITLTFIGFSSFSASGSDADAKEYKTYNGITLEVIGKEGGEEVVKFYQLGKFGSSYSKWGNYSTLEKGEAALAAKALSAPSYYGPVPYFITEMAVRSSKVSELNLQ